MHAKTRLCFGLMVGAMLPSLASAQAWVFVEIKAPLSFASGIGICHNYIQPTSINDTPAVVMYSVNQKNPIQNWVWSGLSYATSVLSGQPGDTFIAMNDTGTYLGTNAAGNTFLQTSTGTRSVIPGEANKDLTVPYGFNINNNVVGVDTTAGQGYTYSAGYTAYKFTGSSSTGFAGINDKGDVAGTYVLPSSPFSSCSFMLKGGKTTKISIPGATSVTATAINNSDQIGGRYVASNGSYYGFSWAPTGVVWTVDYQDTNMPVCVMGPKAPLVLVQAAGTGTTVTAINARGQVAGNATGKFTDGWLYEYAIFCFIGTPIP